MGCRCYISWSPRMMLHIAPSRGMSPILVVTQNDVTYRPITWDVTDPRGHPISPHHVGCHRSSWSPMLHIAPSRGMSPILVVTQNDVTSPIVITPYHVGCHRSSWSPRMMLHIAPSRGMSPILVVTQNDVTYRPITWDVTDPRGHPE